MTRLALVLALDGDGHTDRPSQLRIGTLRWTGSAFRRTFRVVSS